MSPAPHLEVVATGALASVQDFGRRGYRRVGVPWAGALDPRLMRIANALVGNAGSDPVIESFDGGLQFVARGGRVRVGVAGDAGVEIEHAGERQLLTGWRSLLLCDGDVLRIRRVDRGRIVVIAVEGMALPLVLGSASTYARAALGGIDGQTLAPGARLPARAAPERQEQMLATAPQRADGPIRVIAGPQADFFDAASLRLLCESDYRVTTDADRMGVRLEGPVLQHVDKREIVSDATVPGSIQVPGNGQPIVLLADAQTAGGYPKIATVISADLPRLAASRPGQLIRFAFVDADEGERIARAAEVETLEMLASLRPLLVGGVDESALYTSNLVSGVVHALSTQYRPLPAEIPACKEATAT